MKTSARKVKGHDIPSLPGERCAIAFSGGGDSTALVHMMRHRSPRPLVLIVDHNLRSGSKDEALKARDFAVSLGYEARILTWDHDTPKTGLQEKARKARYGLLGQACRERGRDVLLTGHTEDDQAETLLMRYDKATDWRGAVGITEMTYAPVWPELAGITISRPLLGMSRSYLRQYNKRYDLSWAEDPGNENLDFTRIRARGHLAARPALRKHFLKTAKALLNDRQGEYAEFMKVIGGWTFGWAGDITCPHMPAPELLNIALRCAGGGSGHINRKKVGGLRRKWTAREIDNFTIAGAMVIRGENGLTICRDPVAVTGRSDGNLPAIASPMTPVMTPKIWDGRFLMSTAGSGYDIHARHKIGLPLSSHLSGQLKLLHPLARKTAPVVVFEGNAYALSEAREIACQPLVKRRIEAILNPHGTLIA